jgi:diaminohydroxyphosphoribosylaminopyrimidine deaminase/5-amino-6-(5-phosphoribosylamino)uracil reductase
MDRGLTVVAGGDDRRWLAYAVELARRCPPSVTAFSVGAVILAGDPGVTGDGSVLATGYSREEEPHDHAEEVALRRIGAGRPPVSLATATLYSSLEPCSARASRPRTCTELILAAGVGRVVFAWREPSVFVDCRGAQMLAAAGVEVVELPEPELVAAVRSVNAHLLHRG